MGEDTTAGQERGNVGLRFPFGVSVEPDHLPLEVYFEIAPVWVMSPVSHGGFDGGIGIRFFLYRPQTKDTRHEGRVSGSMSGRTSVHVAVVVLGVVVGNQRLGGEQEACDDAAFCSAERVTLVGSMTPALMRSS